MGTLVGLNWLALSVGTSTGPPLAGLLLDATQAWAVDSWHLVLYCAAASLAVSLATLTLCWPTDFEHEQELLASGTPVFFVIGRSDGSPTQQMRMQWVAKAPRGR